MKKQTWESVHQPSLVSDPDLTRLHDVPTLPDLAGVTHLAHQPVSRWRLQMQKNKVAMGCPTRTGTAAAQPPHLSCSAQPGRGTERL